MAITPRSFVLNPALLFIACVVGLGLTSLVLFSGSSSESSSWSGALKACQPANTPESHWTERQWHAHVQCLMDRDTGDLAYEAANRAATHYPRSEAMLNLRGFVAGRNGNHAIASYDFRLGKQVTGSPSGVFENNIAWTALWQLQGLSTERKERVLLQSRDLYRASLAKGVSCERLHTGMFVEHAIAQSHASRDGRSAQEVRHAVSRYLDLYQRYQNCWSRVGSGDELVVEEIFSAAVVDQQMGYIAGVRQPTRHFYWLDQSMERADTLGVDVDQQYCSWTLPNPEAVQACKALLR